jgi:enoyl-CoA hydratase/carnithine racemase
MTGRELKTTGSTLAHAIEPKECVQERAFSIAAELADVPRHALLLLKERLAARRLAKFESVWSEERAMHRRIFSDPDAVGEISTRYSIST